MIKRGGGVQRSPFADEPRKSSLLNNVTSAITLMRHQDNLQMKLGYFSRFQSCVRQKEAGETKNHELERWI